MTENTTAKVIALALCAGFAGGGAGAFAVGFIGFHLLNEGYVFSFDYDETVIDNDSIELIAYEIRENGLYCKLKNNSTMVAEYVTLKVNLRTDGQLIRSEELHLYPDAQPNAEYETIERLYEYASGEPIDLTVFDTADVQVLHAGTF